MGGLAAFNPVHWPSLRDYMGLLKLIDESANVVSFLVCGFEGVSFVQCALCLLLGTRPSALRYWADSPPLP